MGVRLTISIIFLMLVLYSGAEVWTDFNAAIHVNFFKYFSFKHKIYENISPCLYVCTTAI